ncbi:major facilitator superfamily transporter [Aspergillus saccharolyticus JOP 1030-1]|uniref:Major facilitator superfamily transporter n=1 Tax=Aspergillus saccharolyticus JOP 1030-1 TaxID=1450539 RepID=A0A318ZNX1_9EURO|nr:major facilitator superfamily transporter [Aspergillus saccharolyticus JOP 1030-1]PYH49321.1 major facilitator superfamily transporter [Aspergillus saccharolyticus JOP 1030-1]
MDTSQTVSGVSRPETKQGKDEKKSNVQAFIDAAPASEEGFSRPKSSRLSVVLMIIFSGLAIGSDGFNASIIGNLELIMEVIYPDALTTAVASRLSNAFMVGMIIGMLSFGYVSDKLGRKTGAVLTTAILVLGIALSAGASGTSQDGMLWMLIIARGIAGVGAGGEYPVAGAGVAEATDEESAVRSKRGFIFAMIADLSASLGFAFGALVPLLLLLCFHQQVRHYNAVWRISLALGAIPPLSIFWFRYRMAVSSAYKKSAMVEQRIPYRLALRRYWRPLLGVCGSWFLYNYISYPFGLFSSTIVGRVNPTSSLALTMAWGTLINCFYIPGAFIGGYLSDRIGRRRTMALGFLLQAILGFVLGGALKYIESSLPLFIVLYGVFLTLGEVGPGSTIVLTASESFPTALRGHGVGLAAAWSKAGAAIGTQVFKPILASWGDDEFHGTQAVFLIGSGFAVVGALLAWFVLEDRSAELDNGDQEWKDHLAANGYRDVRWGVSDGVDDGAESKVVV